MKNKVVIVTLDELTVIEELELKVAPESSAGFLD